MYIFLDLSKFKNMSNLNLKVIGLNIKKARFVCDMSLRELSRKTGISVKNLSDIENSKTLNPKIVTLYKIAEVFNYDITRLLRGIK